MNGKSSVSKVKKICVLFSICEVRKTLPCCDSYKNGGAQHLESYTPADKHFNILQRKAMDFEKVTLEFPKQVIGYSLELLRQ